MKDEYFFCADGELLVVPQQGSLRFRTEFGVIEAGPGEIVIIPRGVIISVELIDGPARAYVCENYGGGFTLPDRGPSAPTASPTARFPDARGRLRGSRGAGPAAGEVGRPALRHRDRAVAARRRRLAWQLRALQVRPADLFAGRRHRLRPSRSVDLHGADLALRRAGTANIDFVIFPERWMVAEDTFRPPWYHRNIMSEFMGLIYGVYDAKPQGFVPGGFSLHNMMLPHGPGRSRLRGREHGRAEAAQAHRHHGLHVRDALRPARDEIRSRAARPAARLHRLLDRPQEALRSTNPKPW